MTSITPTTESNVLNINDDTETVLEQLPSQNQPRPKQEHTGSEQRIIGDNHDYHGNNGNDTGEGGTKLKTTNSLELDQADWYGNLPIHHECSKLEYLSEKGRERDSFVSSTRMESSQPILSTKERKLESLMKIKEFVKQNPECVKQSNQFGFLPLHCTLDKTRPNALVVEYLVEAFPDALYIASNEGMKPYDLMIKWDHPDDIFWIILKANPALDWRHYAELKYGWFLAYFCGVCLIPKIYRKNSDYGEEYYDGQSDISYSNSSISDARSLRKTLTNSFQDSTELGIEVSNDTNINVNDGDEDQPMGAFRKISTGDEERGARKISANTSLVNENEKLPP